MQLNATLSGVIEQAAKADLRVLGARNGIEGVFKENFIDLTQRAKDEEFISLLSKTPASALGSCRYKLNTKNIEEFEKIVEVFHRNDIAYFVYIGGMIRWIQYISWISICGNIILMTLRSLVHQRPLTMICVELTIAQVLARQQSILRPFLQS